MTFSKYPKLTKHSAELDSPPTNTTRSFASLQIVFVGFFLPMQGMYNKHRLIPLGELQKKTHIFYQHFILKILWTLSLSLHDRVVLRENKLFMFPSQELSCSSFSEMDLQSSGAKTAKQPPHPATTRDQGHLSFNEGPEVLYQF